MPDLLSTRQTDDIPIFPCEPEEDDETAQRDDERAASRYRWESLLPFNPVRRRGHMAKQRFPAMHSGWLSLATLHWMNSLMWTAIKRPLELSDMYRIHPRNRAESAGGAVVQEWESRLRECGGDASKVSVQACLLYPIRWRMFLAFLFMSLFCVLAFTGQAIFVFQLLNFAQKPADEDVDSTEGLLLVLGVFLNEVFRPIIFGIYWYYGIDMGLRLRSAIAFMVYRKIVKLRNLANMTLGQLVNLCVNDGERLFITGMLCGFLIQAPLMVIAVTAYTVYLVGWPAILGQLTFFIFFAILMAVGRSQAKCRRRAIVVTDVRVRTMNEILTYVKLIKMYAWEQPFAKYVAGVREREKVELRKAAYYQAVSSSSSPVIPALATVVTLAAQTLTGGSLSVPTAFAILSAHGSMQHSLGGLPYFVRAFSEARIALPRLKELLSLPERVHVSDKMSDDRFAVEIKDATLAWDSRQAPDESSPSSKKPYSAGAASGEGRRTPKPVVVITTHSGVTKVGNGKVLDGQSSPTARETETAVLPEEIPDCLMGVSLAIMKGQLVGVCGAFGSGKSSLLSALLGGMNVRKGSIAINDSVAYVSQQAWIINASVRENILFGKDYDQERYQRVLAASALVHDLNILGDGDQTEIGERGINLSGGQKQRVSLARALYAQRDVYLLDDPLSAVDAHVGAHIFNELIKKELAGKTVLLVTHQLQYLPSCDRVVMMVGGRIEEEGTYPELLAKKGSFCALMEQFQQEEESRDEDRENLVVANENGGSLQLAGGLNIPDKSASTTIPVTGMPSVCGDNESYVETTQTENSAPNPMVLVKTEDRTQGGVSWSTYWSFIQACGGSLAAIAMLLLTLLATGAKAGADYWLSYWLRQGSGGNATLVGNTSLTMNNTASTMAGTVSTMLPTSANDLTSNIADNPQLVFYVVVYCALAIALVALSIARGHFAMYILLRGCSRLHDMVFRKVFRAPMSFFETTPTGQIINRFSKDMDELDALMPFVLGIVVRNWMTVLLAVIFASVIYPVLFAVLFFIVLVFLLIYKLYIYFARDIKRLDGITRSPYISHLTTTVQGLSSVHAYRKTHEYCEIFDRLLDCNSACFSAFHYSSRWLSCRLDLLVAVMIAATALVLVLSRGSVDVTLGGIALSYVVQLGSVLQLTVRMTSELEARFTSVERLNYYATQLDEEPPEHIEESRPPASWPSQGAVTFRNVHMRYREGTPLVLRDLSFSIRAKEKVGVVGRTGAGKSSLAVCLLRLVDIESGAISIDDIDIHGMGLNDVRSRMSVIPQDPVLFVGTILYNLDPFNRHTDDEIQQALEQTHLKDTVAALPDGLQTEVLENGENFSVGERQLVCMARALLRKSKVLILDEATASIDTETDVLIQKTIRDCFADCTLLTIAHRLNTILDSDRLLVMDEGRVAEFDTPESLLANPQSLFSKMMTTSSSNSKTEQRGKRTSDSKHDVRACWQ